MQGSATVHMAAPPERIWDLVADVRNIGRFSPETFEAEWLDGATGPAVGARFRGHVRRNGIGPVYWTTCRVTECEPNRVFGFAVLAGDRALNRWRYELTPAPEDIGGTDVTESFKLADSFLTNVYYYVFGGFLRQRNNIRDMRRTLERIRDVVEGVVEPG